MKNLWRDIDNAIKFKLKDELKLNILHKCFGYYNYSIWIRTTSIIDRIIIGNVIDEINRIFREGKTMAS